MSYPKTFGDFKVIGKIGSGTFSVVVKAVNVKTNEIYACKIINRSFIVESESLQLLESELRILERLQHNNIAKLEKILYLENYIIIVMEYCCRGSLYDYVVLKGRLSEQETCIILRQLLGALEFLHARNISHRDIKLDNIVLTQDCSPKLIDFGLSIISDKQNTLRKTFCGTEEYIAPEIVKGEKYDPKKADIWALGICAYTMATSCFPWHKSTRSVRQSILEDEIELPCIFSPRFRKLIFAMLEKDPAKRPTASELIAITMPSGLIRRKTSNCRNKIIKPIMRRNSHDIRIAVRSRIFQSIPKSAILCN